MKNGSLSLSYSPSTPPIRCLSCVDHCCCRRRLFLHKRKAASWWYTILCPLVIFQLPNELFPPSQIFYLFLLLLLLSLRFSSLKRRDIESVVPLLYESNQSLINFDMDVINRGIGTPEKRKKERKKENEPVCVCPPSLSTYIRRNNSLPSLILGP